MHQTAMLWGVVKRISEVYGSQLYSSDECLARNLAWGSLEAEKLRWKDVINFFYLPYVAHSVLESFILVEGIPRSLFYYYI